MLPLNYDLQQYTQKTNSIAGTVNTLIETNTKISFFTYLFESK